MYLSLRWMINNNMKISEIESMSEGWKHNLVKLAVAGATMFNNTQGVGADLKQKATIYKIVPQLYKDIAKSIHAKVLHKAALKAGIEGEELVALMAQTAHETGNFKHMSEIGSPEYFINKYENPRMAKILGNVDKDGNVIEGSGARYKARGPIGLTGKYNYRKAGEALGLPLEENPELVNRPDIGANVTIWFWKNKVSPKVNDFNNTDLVTKRINPGMAGAEARKEKHEIYKKVPPKIEPKEKARRP